MQVLTILVINLLALSLTYAIVLPHFLTDNRPLRYSLFGMAFSLCLVITNLSLMQVF